MIDAGTEPDSAGRRRSGSTDARAISGSLRNCSRCRESATDRGNRLYCNRFKEPNLGRKSDLGPNADRRGNLLTGFGSVGQFLTLVHSDEHIGAGLSKRLKIGIDRRDRQMHV